MSDEKIVVAFVSWTLIGMGGSEHVVYDIARKLDRKHFSVIIISFEDGPVRYLYEEIGIKVHVLLKKKKNDINFYQRFRKILNKEKIDIINAHHYYPFIYSFIATIGTSIKLIYTEHSRWQLEQLPIAKKILNIIMLRKSDALVAISKQIEDYYLHRLRINPIKICQISNGVDLDIYKKKVESKIKQDIGLQLHEKTIGMVANLRPEKNHKLLISAFVNVVKVMKDVRLILIGLDCMNGEIQSFANQTSVSDKIHFLGQREDIPELLSILDIICLPSQYEGLPLTILEGMACGVPVVGSDVLGISEVVEHDVNGLLFPLNDERKLTDTLLLVLNDSKLRDRFSKDGRLFVIQNYSLDKKVGEYERLFRSIFYGQYFLSS